MVYLGTTRVSEYSFGPLMRLKVSLLAGDNGKEGFGRCQRQLEQVDKTVRDGSSLFTRASDLVTLIKTDFSHRVL